jgi:hypothetical protein
MLPIGFAGPLHGIANRGRVHDDSGSAPLQWIRTAFQNVHVPSLVSDNQRCGEAAERSPYHNGPGHAAFPRPRTVGANIGDRTVAIAPRIAALAAVVVGAGRNYHSPPAPNPSTSYASADDRR